MEAVTAILGGGLRVGDNKTLLQTGISHDNKLDALGFSMQPNSSPASPPLSSEDHPCLLPCDTSQPQKRYPPAPNAVQQGTSDASPEPHVPNFCNFIEYGSTGGCSSIECGGTGMFPCRSQSNLRLSNIEFIGFFLFLKWKHWSKLLKNLELECVHGEKLTWNYQLCIWKSCAKKCEFSIIMILFLSPLSTLLICRWLVVKLRTFDNAEH